MKEEKKNQMENALSMIWKTAEDAVTTKAIFGLIPSCCP